MSRMTKFLRQTCYIQPYELDPSGAPKLNDFGEIQYQKPIKCRCRKESSYQDVQTGNGHIVKAVTRYYLDESLKIRADYLIDDRAILTVNEYVNAQGLTEGYEVYV